MTAPEQISLTVNLPAIVASLCVLIVSVTMHVCKRRGQESDNQTRVTLARIPEETADKQWFRHQADMLQSEVMRLSNDAGVLAGRTERQEKELERFGTENKEIDEKNHALRNALHAANLKIAEMRAAIELRDERLMHQQKLIVELKVEVNSLSPAPKYKLHASELELLT